MNTSVESNVWGRVLHSLESKLNQQALETWFRPIQFERLDSSQQVIHLRVPNQIVRDWVVNNYAQALDESLNEQRLTGYSVGWVIGKVPESAPAVESPDQKLTFDAAVEVPADTPTDIAPTANRAPAIPINEPSLSSKYTYESFVVGSCNQFAHAASLAVAEAPGRTYNPLYLYGGVGLGKTHLMHACGHAIKSRNQHLKLCYISSERFMNDLINAIRYDKTQSFREKYRSVDVLLIDDVQFMAGKERTQEEFFHTFNALYDQQKQIVISSDCPPREIPTLEERLHSRFEWGLIADIEPPDLETKIAILKRKGDLIGVTIPNDVAMFIAGRVKSNVRELEGSLVRLIAISSLRGEPISKTLAQDAIRNFAKEEEAGVITIQQIQKLVAQTYKLTSEELVSKNNARNISHPRQVAMYLCKHLTKHSYPEIGRAFGGKHHTTVMHSVEKIETLVVTDETLQRLISELSESLRK
ncbi:MAG: chromosomal replication initiator protein DnaA [Acidobacteria bacterium]|nr:chromosomal replication initiator protein DnaA [Acidobacteriota bacterium]MCA1627715.1 chromosomal replication initiator protein DnaA [Acidobacteriota bacterium]